MKKARSTSPARSSTASSKSLIDSAKILVLVAFAIITTIKIYEKKKKKKKLNIVFIRNNRKRKPTKNKFVRRLSRLDYHTESDINRSSFWGFSNLLIMAMTLFVASSHSRHLLYQGSLLGLDMTMRIFLYHLEIFPLFGLMVLVSFTAVLIQKLVLKQWLSWTSATIVHVIWMVSFSMGAASVLFERDWPAVQTTFYTLEVLVILMKMHSYFVSNKELALDRDANTQYSIKERYPHNVSLWNFLDFLLVPCFVYEPAYPRTEKIRWVYVFEKTLSLLGLWTVLNVLTTVYVEPTLKSTADISMLEAVQDLIVPFVTAEMILFYVVFDVIANAFAELTCFADREFYSDWWNSTTFDEFSRKWNKPVHEFLLRHIYLESLQKAKLNETSAVFLTFFISSVVHELFMTTLFRMFRPIFFAFQMFQLPLIYFARFLKGTRAGNLFFWFGLVLGPPLISVLYCREYYISLKIQ